MKVLFLTRVHPPIIGGMETQSYNLINNFKKTNNETYAIINTKGKKNLPVFMPYSFLRAVYLIKKHRITHLHLSDALLAPEGYAIKKLTGIKTLVTIHGLDITYKNPIYQKIIPNSVKKLDGVICVSNHTLMECVKRGISKEKCRVIPNGIDSREYVSSRPKDILRKELSQLLNTDLKNKKVLLTNGRLIKRKGISWFVDEVMPNLNSEYIYIISGDGPERGIIQQAIEKQKLEKRVFMLGRTDSNTLKLLYNSCDIFIMPNLSVDGDMEGFGMVVLEAGSCGLPIIASKIEGLKDSIIEGRTGRLVKERDSKGFLEAINGQLPSRLTIMSTISNNFGWNHIIEKYLEAFELT